jgi:hypothetical protein
VVRIREHHRESPNFFARDDVLWNGMPEIGVEALIATLDDSKVLIQALKENFLYRSHLRQVKKSSTPKVQEILGSKIIE